MSVMLKILSRVKRLEEEVALLKERKLGRPGKRTEEMIEWIRKMFEKDEEIEVAVIRVRARAKGFNYQMVSNTRRDHMEDEIGVVHSKGMGWTWIKLNQKQTKQLRK